MQSKKFFWKKNLTINQFSFSQIMKIIIKIIKLRIFFFLNIKLCLLLIKQNIISKVFSFNGNYIYILILY